jgi:hypothetical protein
MRHLANRSPNKDQQNQPQQQARHGKVNHVVAEEAQNTSGVVLGMFPVNSNPATVLFDSSASNSFISSKFVAQYNIPKIVMKWKMIVQSPRGELLSRHVCPNISISIRGVDFLAHLIVLESKGIDIILGMDWLTKHDGIIGCTRKVIQLRHPDGTKVEYQAEVEATERIQLN